MQILYKIPAPYTARNEMIEVYGEPNMGWYEWRVVEDGLVLRDTKNKLYDCAEIALRDALNAMSTEDEWNALVANKVPTQSVASDLSNDVTRSASKLMRMKDELQGMGLESALFWKSPGQTKTPVAFLLVGESSTDVELARQSIQA